MYNVHKWIVAMDLSYFKKNNFFNSFLIKYAFKIIFFNFLIMQIKGNLLIEKKNTYILVSLIICTSLFFTKITF